MSSRERILAALKRQPVDHIPFTPLMDTYTIKSMPKPLVDEAMARGYNRGLMYVSRQIGMDIMLRHVVVADRRQGQTPFLCALGAFDDTVSTWAENDGNIHREIMETRVGTLSATYAFTSEVGWIPHPITHFVNNHDELKVFLYAMEHLSTDPPTPKYENFLSIDAEVGDDGIATTSFSDTPLMYLIEMVWGLENTYYLLHDYPDEVNEVMERGHIAQKRFVEALGESPAQVIINYENTSSTLLSRDMFRQHCLPYLNVYADILRAAGKTYIVHACGKLSAFVDDLKEGRWVGMSDIAPPPTGDLPLDVAAESLGGQVVIGGIDATTYVNNNDDEVQAEITGLLERLKRHRGVLLGSADTAPRETTIERFRQIYHLAGTVGAYT